MAESVLGLRATRARFALPEDYVVSPFSEVGLEVDRVLGQELHRQRDVLKVIASDIVAVSTVLAWQRASAPSRG